RRSASGARTDRLIPVLFALFRGSFLPRRPRPFLCRGAGFGQFSSHQDDPEDQGGDTEDAPLERVAQTAPVHGDAGGWLRRRDGGQSRSGRVVLGQYDVPLVEVVFPLLEEYGRGYAFDLPLGHLHRPDTFRGGLGGQQPTGGGDLPLRWGGKIVILVLRPTAADGESHAFVDDQGKDHVEAFDTVSGPRHEQLGIGVVVSGGFDGAVGDPVRVQILAGFEVGVD